MARVAQPKVTSPVVSPVSQRRRIARFTKRGKVDIAEVVREYGPERSRRMLRAAGVERPAEITRKTAEFLANNVRLDSGEYVPRDVYEKLSVRKVKLNAGIGAANWATAARCCWIDTGCRCMSGSSPELCAPRTS